MFKNRAAILGYVILIITLTAGTAQSLTGSNTVFTDDIVDNNITAADLGTNSVTSTKVAPNTLTGSDINESSLALTCPSGTTLAQDVCYSPGHAPATWGDAASVCLAAGLRLPTLFENIEISKQVGEVGFSNFWTDVVFTDGDLKAMTSSSDVFNPAAADIVSSKGFFCVTAVGARPVADPSPTGTPGRH